MARMPKTCVLALLLGAALFIVGTVLARDGMRPLSQDDVAALRGGCSGKCTQVDESKCSDENKTATCTDNPPPVDNCSTPRYKTESQGYKDVVCPNDDL
jgi:hypothetical protein